MFDFVTEAKRTLSDNFHGDQVSSIGFLTAIHDYVQAGMVLDTYKKAIFYGGSKHTDKLYAMGGHHAKPDNDIYTFIGAPGISPVLLHMMLGIACEGPELMEHLADVLTGTKLFDAVNFEEECGDTLWFLNIGLGEVGSDEDVAKRKTIDKLAKRYPEKFEEYNANNRDLFAEREALEEAPATLPIGWQQDSNEWQFTVGDGAGATGTFLVPADTHYLVYREGDELKLITTGLNFLDRKGMNIVCEGKTEKRPRAR